MTDAITRPLAALMAALHPGFDIPGCAAAIHKARHLAPPDQLAHAAIDLAKRADLRTPALLADPTGPWWQTGRTPDARVEPARCPIHEHELAHNCRACAGDLHAGDVPGHLVLADLGRVRDVDAGAAAVQAKYTRPAWLDQPA